MPRQATVKCLYNKHFFVQIYKAMVAHQHDTVFDASNTMWHIMDIEEILVKEYGCRRAGNGSSNLIL